MEIISFSILISVLLAFLVTVLSAYFLILASSSGVRFSAFTNYFWSSKLASNLGWVFLFLSISLIRDDLVLLGSSRLDLLECSRISLMLKLPIFFAYFIPYYLNIDTISPDSTVIMEKTDLNRSPKSWSACLPSYKTASRRRR